MVAPINRLSGLVSGLDTDQMVKDLMKAERKPLEALLRKKQTEEWKRDAYREMNALLLNFRNQVSNLRLQGTFLKKTASSENDAYVSVKLSGKPNLDSYSVKVDSLAQAATSASIKYTNTVADGNTEIGGNDFKLTIQGGDGTAKTVEIKGTDTINQVIQKINVVSGDTKVFATYLAAEKSITFVSKQTGDSSSVSIQVEVDANGDGVPDVDETNSLGISDKTTADSSSPPDVIVTQGQDGQKGKVYINGTLHEVSSNTFIYDGIEFTLRATTGSASININTKTDEDAIFDAITEFVDQYNELISQINAKLSEPKYRDYHPLLEEEKEAMEEKTIELWEEKAKSGILQRDSILSNVLSRMRLSISSKVSGVSDTKFDMLSEIGISTAKADADSFAVNYAERGKLYIDEDKLRQAIRENGANVMELFTKTGSTTEELGIAHRLYADLKDGIDKILDKAGSTGMGDEAETYEMGKSMKQINDSIERWEDRLEEIQERYYRQFTAMERALQQMNAQSAWLYQQFSQGQ